MIDNKTKLLIWKTNRMLKEMGLQFKAVPFNMSKEDPKMATKFKNDAELSKMVNVDELISLVPISD